MATRGFRGRWRRDWPSCRSGLGAAGQQAMENADNPAGNNQDYLAGAVSEGLKRKWNELLLTGKTVCEVKTYIFVLPRSEKAAAFILHDVQH